MRKIIQSNKNKNVKRFCEEAHYIATGVPFGLIGCHQCIAEKDIVKMENRDKTVCTSAANTNL